MYIVDSLTSMHDCECCGFYSHENVSISYNRDTLESFYYESHFGRGNWDGDWVLVYASLLRHACYKIVFSLLLTSEMDKEIAQANAEYYQYYKEEDLLKINVVVAYKSYLYNDNEPPSEDNSYDFPLSFTFTFEEKIHVIETDDYKKFYESAAKIITKAEFFHQDKN